jgi:hypothetical protein
VALAGDGRFETEAVDRAVRRRDLAEFGGDSYGTGLVAIRKENDVFEPFQSA